MDDDYEQDDEQALDLSYETFLRKRRTVGSEEDTIVSSASAGDTTFALLECAELVVAPILQSMSLLAWQPITCVSERWRGVVNWTYFTFIILVFLYDYAYSALGCIQSTQCTGLISKYTVPPIIHFSSFLCGAYYFRKRSGIDTSRGLIEAVFLQSTKSSSIVTVYGDLSQARLTRVLRQYLWWGVLWLALRMAASGLTSLFALQELIVPEFSDVTNTALAAFKVVSSLACDGVYTLTITVYAIHCGLLCFYIDGWKHRIGQRMFSLSSMKQEVVLIQRHVRSLNQGFGWPISLAFLQFSVEILRQHDSDIYKISLVFEFITWTIILVFTLGQASSVSDKCLGMKAQGVKLRNEGYMNATREDLDSFLLFLLSLQMEARVFGACVSPSSRSVFLVTSSILILVLFRANVLAISWF